MQKMRIRIGKDGKVSIQVEGGHGSDCEVFTKAIENAVGNVEARAYLPEYTLDPVYVPVDERMQEREGR